MDARLSAWIAKLSFSDMVIAIEPSLLLLREASDAARNSAAMRQVFGVVLAVGNHMNGGTRRYTVSDSFSVGRGSLGYVCKCDHDNVTMTTSRALAFCCSPPFVSTEDKLMASNSTFWAAFQHRKTRRANGLSLIGLQ